jgi:hypothetical protein
VTRTAAVALCAIAITLCLPAPPAALADHTQESVFQDDAYLLYSPSLRVNHTLALLKDLGVDRVRINVNWSTIAPDPQSSTAPAGFNGFSPSSYPAANWGPYDRLVQYAAAYGIGVDFNLTAPGPLWAMARGAPTTVAANHWSPNAADFLEFAYAVGVRYSGAYIPPGAAAPLPRVDYWSIWNEPNQPGWLAPQWRRYHGKQVLNSPRLYRRLAEYAYAGLSGSGHGHDTVLIGELAPEGLGTPGYYNSSTPMPFLRALYCVNSRYRRLTGKAAAALGCPTKGTAKQFKSSYPVLFDSTGFAHHPYYFHYPPGYSSPNPDYAPLSDLGRLEHGLDRAFSAYGSRRHLPIYITEYGYGTNPPNPRQNVTPAEQAEYLNQAEYMAWSDPRVRSTAQFLLVDSAPNHAYPKTNLKYWDTFQTGLEFINGRQKPAFAAYRLPIWIRSFKGDTASIWGQVRPGPHHRKQRIELQWRPLHGHWTDVQAISLKQAEGYFTASVHLAGPGDLRTAWRSPGGHTYYSRVAPT